MATVDAYYLSESGSGGWEDVDNMISNNNIYASTGETSPATVLCNITNTVPTGGTTTSITFYVRAEEGALADATITVSLYINSTYYAKSVTALTTTETEYSYTWNGSWTVAQTNAMQLRIVGTFSSKAVAYVDYIHCTQTYTGPPWFPTSVSTSETPCYDGISTITWTKSDDATKYRVYECTTYDGTYSAIGSELGDVAEGPTDTETTSVTMYYKVKAGNTYGWSDLSDTYATVVFIPPSPPTSVDTSESPCEDGQSTITWTKSTNTTKNRIYESTTSGGSYSAIGSELGDVSEGPTDVETVAQTLYYKLKAGNGDLWSDLSATYATVVFVFGYDKTINEVSDYTHINGIAIADITEWNGVS